MHQIQIKFIQIEIWYAPNTNKFIQITTLYAPTTNKIYTTPKQSRLWGSLAIYLVAVHSAPMSCNKITLQRHCLHTLQQYLLNLRLSFSLNM